MKKTDTDLKMHALLLHLAMYVLQLINHNIYYNKQIIKFKKKIRHHINHILYPKN